MTVEPQTAAVTLLSRDDRRTLLRTAREAIAAAARDAPPPVVRNPTPPLATPSGVFVSLHHHLRLRGCVGTLQASQPLWLAVARMAVAAAFEDPRFPPLVPADLPELEIEISRLTAPTAVSASAIVPGRHGVCVARGSSRGVFLPQVAPHFGWDREELLTQACLKGLLPPDAWRAADTTILAFEAEVFSDADVTGQP